MYIPTTRQQGRNGPRWTGASIANTPKYVFLNTWRALSPPPQDWPLALVKANTVEEDDGGAVPDDHRRFHSRENCRWIPCLRTILRAPTSTNDRATVGDILAT